MDLNHSDIFYGFSFRGSDSYSGGILNHQYGLPSLSISQDSASDVLAIPGSDCNCNNSVPESFDISKLTNNTFWQQRLGDLAIAHLSGVNLNGENINTAFFLEQPTFTKEGNISFQTKLIGDQNSLSPDLIDHAVIHFSSYQAESDQLINDQGTNIEANATFLNSSLSNLFVTNSTYNNTNNVNIIVPKDGVSDFVPLYLTSPSNSSKSISIESMSDQTNWNNLFGRSMPTASLSWLDSEKQVQQLALTINRPSFNALTNEYVISASSPDGNSIPDLNTISNASLLIDSPGKANIPPYSLDSSDLSESKPQMPPLEVDVLEWVGGVTGAFTAFAATKAIMQWYLVKYINNFKMLREKLLREFPERENDVNEFMSEFNKEYRASVQYINNIPDESGNWGNFDSAISFEDFSKDASYFQQEVLDKVRTRVPFGSDFDTVTKFMQNELKANISDVFKEEISSRFGGNGLEWLRIYERDLDITPEQLLTDEGLYKKFADLAKSDEIWWGGMNFNNRIKFLRKDMQDSGFSCGDILAGCWDGDISSEFTEEPAGDIAGQMIDAGVLDEAEEAGALFIIEDILGILIFE